MPDFHFNCPNCSQSIDAPTEMIGQLIECPSCNQTIEVAKTQAGTSMPKSGSARNNGNAAQKYSTVGRRPNMRNQRGSDKKILPCLLLYIFFGSLGGHAFYAGKASIGVMYIIMLIAGTMIVSIGDDIASFIGGAVLLVYSILLLIDLIYIIVGSYTDENGTKITNWT